MATEYRLNYTAFDIDAKLNVIDGTKTYYTSEEVDERISASIPEIPKLPEIDEAPTENSENLITSGGVYEALQNAGGNGGASEWKDIQNKPGDIIATIVEEDIMNIENLQDVVYEEDAGCYVWFTEYGSDEEYENRGNIIGKEVKISIRKPSDSEPSVYMTEMLAVYEGEQDAVIYFNTASNNFEEWLSSGLPKKDETLPAFILLFVDGIGLYASEDLTGYDIRFYIENANMETVGLPESVLGEEFENIDGKLSLALGKTITTTTEINNSYTTTLGTPNATSPFVIWNNVVKDTKIYDNIQENTPVKVSFIENGETVEIGTYNLFTNSILDTQFGTSSNNTGYYGLVNATQSIEEVLTQGVWTREDSTKPTLTLVFTKSNTSGQSWFTIAAPEMLSGTTFIVEISTTETESKIIKLSNEALNLDTKPTEGSTNFINSGDLYNIIGDIDAAISQLESMIGGASV